jgi:hypothetical protein
MKCLLLAVCLLALAAPASASSGVDFAWGESCWPDNPVDWRTFACDTNAGVEYATGSFKPDLDFPDFAGLEAIVDINSGSSAMPDWWQVWNEGSCRSISLSASADFSGTTSTHCVNLWPGAVVGGIAAYQTQLFPPPPPYNVPLPNRGRIRLGFAMPSYRPRLSRTVEYLAFRLAIDHQRTVGDSACAGCAVPLCLLLNQIAAFTDSGIQDVVTSTSNNRSLQWNDPPWYLCHPVPVQNTTWGRMTGLYR